jgi:hypothetical protein
MSDEKRGRGVPFVKGSETSADAADDILPSQMNLRNRLTYIFRHYGKKGLTDEMLEDMTGMKHQTVSARRREMEQKGVIQKLYVDGKHLKHQNKSGSNAGLYILSIYAPEDPPQPEPEPVSEDPVQSPVGAYDTSTIPDSNNRLSGAMAHHANLVEAWRSDVAGFHGPFMGASGVPEMTRCLENSFTEMMGMVESFQLANQIQVLPSPKQGRLFGSNPVKGDKGG